MMSTISYAAASFSPPANTAATRRLLVLFCLSAGLALSGCATVQNHVSAATDKVTVVSGQIKTAVVDNLTDNISPDDPIEPVNRVVYKFNDTFDRVLLQPVAQGYVKVVPQPVRNCVRNFFSNIVDVPTALNNLLQGKVRDAASDSGRFVINTTAGILGCFDVASEAGLEKHKEDFGQTMGVWGVPSGPYLMLPFLGPSTVRDAFGTFTVDSKTNLIFAIQNIPVRNETYVLNAVDYRASGLDARGFIQGAALDPYVFIREAYLGRRRNQISDGNTTPSQAAEASDAGSAKADTVTPMQAATPATPQLSQSGSAK